MATNESFRDGDSLTLPVPNSTASGSPVRVGAYATGLNGVTQTATDSSGGTGQSGNPTGYASVRLRGVHKLAVSTTTPLAVLDPVYITSANVLTPSASGNKLFGHALEAKGATAGQVIRIRIANPTT